MISNVFKNAPARSSVNTLLDNSGLVNTFRMISGFLGGRRRESRGDDFQLRKRKKAIIKI